MKRVMSMNFLVCVFVGGKCKDLFYSENLKMLPAIQSVVKDCEIEVFNLTPYHTLWEKKKRAPKKLHIASDSLRLQKRGKLPYKVICTTTGVVYESVDDCSRALGIPRMTIYQAINKGFAASKMHFKYLIEEMREEDEDE